MKRCLYLAVLLLGACVLHAQAAFPITLKAFWNPPVNAALDGVTSYKFMVGTGSPVVYGTPVVVPATLVNDPVNCPAVANPTGCVMTTFAVPASGVYTLAVSAVSQYGVESLPATATANINTPGTVVWVKVTK